MLYISTTGLPFTESALADEESFLLEKVSLSSFVDVPVLKAQRGSDAGLGRGGSDIKIEDSMALVSSGPVGEDIIDVSRQHSTEVSVYTVRPGDSLSQIAEMFGVTTNTILWANDLKGPGDIHPGTSLVILPVEGVRHVVKSGDTLATLASKYEVESEEIVEYNLLADSSLTVGETLIIPGGKVHAPAPAKVAAKNGGSTASKSSTGFINPAPGTVKSQGIHGTNAVDLAGAVGTPIRAAAAGTVVVSRDGGWNGGYGTYVVLRHANGVQTLYSHMSRNDVGVGAYVEQGQTIGAVGNTGLSTGPHLHFEVRGGVNPF